MSASSDEQKSKSVSANEISAQPRKLKFKEQQELAGMEATIHAAEEELARLQSLFAAPDFYKRHEEHAGLQAELNSAKEKIAKLYARWEELEAMKE